MIIYAQEGHVLEAEVVARFPAEGRIRVSLDTNEQATLTMRNVAGGSDAEKADRFHALCHPRSNETLRVEVTMVDGRGDRKYIHVRETRKPLTQSAAVGAPAVPPAAARRVQPHPLVRGQQVIFTRPAGTKRSRPVTA